MKYFHQADRGSRPGTVDAPGGVAAIARRLAVRGCVIGRTLRPHQVDRRQQNEDRPEQGESAASKERAEANTKEHLHALGRRG